MGRKPTRGRNITKNKSNILTPNLNKLKQELNSPRDPFKNYKRKLIGLKMNSFTKKKSSKPSLTSWIKHLLKCLDTKTKVSKSIRFVFIYFVCTFHTNILDIKIDPELPSWFSRGTL